MWRQRCLRALTSRQYRDQRVRPTNTYLTDAGNVSLSQDDDEQREHLVGNVTFHPRLRIFLLPRSRGLLLLRRFFQLFLGARLLLGGECIDAFVEPLDQTESMDNLRV